MPCDGAHADLVHATLGPKGRNVALDKKWGAPTVTHDGVTVAKEIELEDPYENMVENGSFEQILGKLVPSAHLTWVLGLKMNANATTYLHMSPPEVYILGCRTNNRR